MPISHEHKCIFVHIPKNAGTTMYKVLGLERTGHFKWNVLKSRYGEKWDEYLTFAIVRNPWDRVVSCYEYAREKESYWHSPGAKKTKYGLHPDYHTLKDKSFEWAVKNIDELEHHGWENQWSYIYDKGIKVDHVLRMENLNTEFDVIRNELDVEKELPVVNSTKEKGYKSYYNRELREIIGNKYRKDINLFNYSFE